MKKKYHIIGKPLSHSLSPLLHNYWFKKYKIDAEYTCLEIEENNFINIIDKVKHEEISGINVTLPYKQKIIPFLDKIVNDAKETFSVNTIFLDDNKNVIGENTDVFGLQAGYLKEILNNEGSDKNALVLGAGGVSSSIILALIKSNIKNISLANRTYEKSLFLKKKFPSINILKWEEYINKTKNYDIIINGTSLGLNNEKNFEIFFKDVKENLVYIDTIYNPLQTQMIKHLKSKNIKTYNGLDMLIYQGQKSFYIWHKINPEIDDELINLLEAKIK